MVSPSILKNDCVLSKEDVIVLAQNASLPVLLKYVTCKCVGKLLQQQISDFYHGER